MVQVSPWRPLQTETDLGDRVSNLHRRTSRDLDTSRHPIPPDTASQKGLGSGGFVFGEVDNANAITQRLVIDNVGNASFFGTVSASCGTLVCSDIRYKKDIEPLQNPLSKILQLNPVSYFFKTETFKEKNFTNSKQIGLIAQELEKIFPEMVSTDKEGYKNVNYTQLIPVMIASIKTLQKEIDDLKQKIK